jgi:hypothetical protein
MRILRGSLFVLLPALLAGYVAWQIIPCQPMRSIRVPAGTKLLEFSAAGQYAVTFLPEDRRLTLWHTNTGTEAFSAEVPNESGNARADYGFSADNRFLAVAVGTPSDLDSGNKEVQAIDLPANRQSFGPHPAFSSIHASGWRKPAEQERFVAARSLRGLTPPAQKGKGANNLVARVPFAFEHGIGRLSFR